MKIAYRVSTLGAFLGCVHLAFALWIYSQHYEGGWGYFPVAVTDFPVTLVLAVVTRSIELSSWWMSYFVFGSLWWYLVGAWLARFIHARKSR